MMEPRFGHDFSRVRVHTDAQAAESARQVNALAFTVGRHIVFGEGRYAPAAEEGNRLLAHELAHVVQQRGASDRGAAEILVGAESDPLEAEAGRVAASVAGGQPARACLRDSGRVIRRVSDPTGIALKEIKPFGHADLKDDTLKQAWRTYIGATTLMQVTPAADYSGYCTKEYLTEVANTCPARFTQLRGPFCRESRCLDFNEHSAQPSGDPETGKMVNDGPDSFIDRHRTHHSESLLEGTGKNKCSVVCHQLYKYDRRKELGSFYIIRNFRAGKYKPPGGTTDLHITTGEVQKVPAATAAPSAAEFAKKVAPGLVQSGKLAEQP
jgi:hypothetical protein